MAGLRWHDWLLSVGQNGCFYSSANNVQERNCAVCGRVFIPKAPHAKYCSEACRREHDLRRVKEARRKGAKPKLDRVDRYLAGSGAVHDEIMAMRREVAMRY